MKFRIALWTSLCLLLVGLILGTFFDMAISEALCFDPNNYILHAITGFGLVIPYSFFALLGGVLVRITIDRKEQKLYLKIILTVLGILFYFAGTYFAAHDNFTVNGLYHTEIEFTILGYLNSVVLNAIAFSIGFAFSKNNENKNLWIAVLIIAAAIFCSQIPGTALLKSAFNRPRFRSLGNGIEFQPWYLPFKGHKSFLTETITSEEFKSFPSGHASMSALMMFYAIFIPPLFPKISDKIRFPLFFVGAAYFLAICYTRIAAGAHFLSDVSFGGLLSMIATIVAYEILKKKQFINI